MTDPFYDEERCLADTDPAKLLPFTIQITPDDPEAEKLPGKYIGTDRQTYGEDKLFYS